MVLVIDYQLKNQKILFEKQLIKYRITKKND